MTDDECATILNTTWALLEAGVASRHSAAHHPVVATLNTDSRPDQRVMILRAADRTSASLRFHTDARSPKVVQIGVGAPVHILVDDPDAKTQLRLAGTARVEMDTPVADAAWDASTTFARRCYMAETGPGTHSSSPTSGLPAWVEGKQPSVADVDGVRRNFAIVVATIDYVDWLHLANSGHRRAILNRQSDLWRGQWVVP